MEYTIQSLFMKKIIFTIYKYILRHTLGDAFSLLDGDLWEVCPGFSLISVKL